MKNSTIKYFPDFATDLTLKGLREGLSWENRDAPRQEAFISTYPMSYTYGKGAGIRTYDSFPIPEWAKSAWKSIEEKSECTFEACFLNYYADFSQHLGWHADDSEIIDQTKPIAVYTLGAEREIWFRSMTDTSVVEKLKLGNGSLLLMLPGMQNTHQHRIPKASYNCGSRISLTFRGIK